MSNFTAFVLHHRIITFLIAAFLGSSLVYFGSPLNSPSLIQLDQLYHSQPAPSSTTVFTAGHSAVAYFVPGINGPNSQGFLRYAECFDEEVDVKVIQYGGACWNPQNIAQRIISDIEDRRYQTIKLFPISIGDRVVKYLEPYFQDHPNLAVEYYSINPCSNPTGLKPWIQIGRFFPLGPAMVAAGAIGSPITLLSFPVNGVQHNLAEEVHECISLAFTDESNTLKPNVIILSTQDEFFDSSVAEYLIAHYGFSVNDGHIKFVHGSHANTVGNFDAYRAALENADAFA